MNAEIYVWTCHNCGSRDELPAGGGNLSCQCGSLHDTVVTKLGTIGSFRP